MSQSSPAAAIAHNRSPEILSLIGDTPLVEVTQFDTGQCQLFLKLENQNPGGSIKDRIALSMIEAAEAEGKLQPGGTVIEATAGNTGLGLALVAGAKGYRVLLVIPDKMSQEKISHVRALGAEVRITRSDVTRGHPEYYQDVAFRLAEEIPGGFYVNQFGNPANPLAHERTTGPEIWEQMRHDVDAVVVGVGSGGTLTGLGRFFNRVKPRRGIEMVLADPTGSVLYEYVKTGQLVESGSWAVEGIGEDFIPDIADMEKGQLRCDCNVSLRSENERELGAKIELKNLNSISGVRRALVYEIRRQTGILKRGEQIEQETRGWDDVAGETFLMSRAKDAEIESVEVQGPSYSPYFYFQDEGTEHAVWYLDAITFLNQLREVRDEKAGGFALYRLGSEDPAIWDALNVPHNFKFDDQTRQSLELIKSTDTITDVGDGEIVTVDEDRTDGTRKLSLDADGYLTAKYVKFAEFPTLYHQGAGGEHQVAITFDDGPDPRWTPKILDILKAANIKATFFVVGVNAERYPALVRRIVNEGHEIGNHTYYHPNLALCWPEHIRLELNATQLLLETITGRATTLFRPPYAADTGPTGLSELAPLKIAEDLNYLVVLENIDPQDWAKPGADIILRRIKQQRHASPSFPAPLLLSVVCL